MHQFPLNDARIDPTAITHNISRFVGSSGTDTPALDVRADGYGHGAVEVARAAERGGAGLLLVSSAVEADALTAAGIRLPTAVVSGDDPALDAGYALTPTAIAYGFSDGDEWRPAMRVLGRVIGVKSIAAGEGVSYGYTFRAPCATTLALVAIGYANGVDRLASNVGTLWLRGSGRPIVGRVAMNALVLDLGDDHAEVEDAAVVFGDPAQGEPSIRSWADALGKSSAEVATNLGARLPRSTS